MKTLCYNVYKFNELNDEQKQQAIENFRNNETFDYVYEEAFETVKKFASLFDINIRSFDFEEPYRSEYTFELNEPVLELSGQRLATYIWNNYRNDLFKGKYYSLWSKTEKTYKYYKEGYPVLKNRHSKVLFDHSCVLTGVCYDEDILEPIYNFLNKPTSDDFKYLLEECLSSICKSVQSEIKGRSTDESIIETIEANDYDFTEDGELA